MRNLFISGLSFLFVAGLTSCWCTDSNKTYTDVEARKDLFQSEALTHSFVNDSGDTTKVVSAPVVCLYSGYISSYPDEECGYIQWERCAQQFNVTSGMGALQYEIKSDDVWHDLLIDHIHCSMLITQSVAGSEFFETLEINGTEFVSVIQHHVPADDLSPLSEIYYSLSEGLLKVEYEDGNFWMRAD
ncbi:MAG: hypothetical protein JNM00_06960 [Flavobacteriales bacterium]|nr:hypothetical protein [Flavobacteriales bacterium]